MPNVSCEYRADAGPSSEASSGVVTGEGIVAKYSEEAEWKEASEAVEEEIFCTSFGEETGSALGGRLSGDTGRFAVNHGCESIWAIDKRCDGSTLKVLLSRSRDSVEGLITFSGTS